MAEHYHDVLGPSIMEQVEHALDKRFAGQRVQHLVAAGAHSGSLAGRKDDRDQGADLRHGRNPLMQDGGRRRLPDVSLCVH